MNVYGILVVYNKDIQKTSYRQLIDKNVNLVVCDNSDIDMNNGAKLDERAHYISMDGNKGLACAYNRALDFIFSVLKPDSDDYVVIFDDDTELPGDYIQELSRHSEDILLPLVSDGVSLMSPCFMRKNIVKRLPDVRLVKCAPQRYLTGINSCMAIKCGVMAGYRYNEDMFLDYIDHSFIKDMRVRRIYPTVLDVDIRQHFSEVDNTREQAYKRFEIMKKDLKHFYGSSPAYYYVTLKRRIKLLMKY